MTSPHPDKLSIRYVDYGKQFLSNGATDFLTLDYSDEELAQALDDVRRRWIRFPDQTPFVEQINNVSVALIAYEQAFLFVQMQRRREGEFSPAPRTNRPFNQLRCSLLTRRDIETALQQQYGLFTALLYDAQQDATQTLPYSERQASYGAPPTFPLKNYKEPGRRHPWYVTLQPLAPLSQHSLVRFLVNALFNAAEPQTKKPQAIALPLPEVDLREQVAIMQAVQYWVYPALGVITFAMDYITEQNVAVRLFAPAPQMLQPPPAERVYRPGQHGPFADDSFAAVKGLNTVELHHPTLRMWLGTDLPSRAAVAMFKLAEQGHDYVETPPLDSILLHFYPEHFKDNRHLQNALRQLKHKHQALLNLAAASPALRMAILHYDAETTRWQLAGYYPYHLAVPLADRSPVRFLLKQVVEHSPVAHLEAVPAGVRRELYLELLRLSAESVVFDDGVSLLRAFSLLLAQENKPELAWALNKYLDESPAFLEQILEEIERSGQISLYYQFWHVLTAQTLQRFCGILSRLVQPKHYAHLAEQASVFQAFLVSGRKLYGTAVRTEQPLLALAISRELNELKPALRRAARVAAMASATFAEWWLYAEVAYQAESAIRTDFEDLVTAMLEGGGAALRAASPRFQYLMLRGQPVAGQSLLTACTLNAVDSPNEEFLLTLLGTWIAHKWPPALEDVVWLIERLPETKGVLAQLVLTKELLPLVRRLPSVEALEWLQRTAAAELRQVYLKDRADRLYTALSELEQPDEFLVWRLVVEEPAAFPPQVNSGVTWADYCQVCADWQKRLDELGFAGPSRLRYYLDVVRHFKAEVVLTNLNSRQLDGRSVARLIADYQVNPQTTVPQPGHLEPLVFLLACETDATTQRQAADLLRTWLLAQPQLRETLLQMGLPGVALERLMDVCRAGDVHTMVGPMAALQEIYYQRIGRQYSPYLTVPSPAAVSQIAPLPSLTDVSSPLTSNKQDKEFTLSSAAAASELDSSQVVSQTPNAIPEVIPSSSSSTVYSAFRITLAAICLVGLVGIIGIAIAFFLAFSRP